MQTLDYQSHPTDSPRLPRPLRRMPSNIAIAFLVFVVIVTALMWIIAIHEDVARLAFTEKSGNHGPWRHVRPLRILDGFAMSCTVLAALPMAFIGAWLEQSPRAVIVLLCAVAAIIANCAHFPLFD